MALSVLNQLTTGRLEGQFSEEAFFSFLFLSVLGSFDKLEYSHFDTDLKPCVSLKILYLYFNWLN